MLKIIEEKTPTVKLQRGKKIVERPYADYKINKSKYDFRGFKLIKDNVKSEPTVEIKPKVKRNVKRTKKEVKETI
jgi:hypothetical protein